MRKKTMWAVGVGVVAVVAVIIALIVVNSGSDEPAAQNQGSAFEETPDHPQESGGESSSSGAGFSTPTQDYLGRQVLVPNNSFGEPMGQLRATPQDICSEDEKMVPAETSIQKTLPVTLWSTEDGPSRIENGVPVGYSHTPRGAALAMWNFWVLTNRSDDVGYEVANHHLELSQEENEEIMSSGYESVPIDPESPQMKMIAPTAYKVTSCSDDYIVFDIARSIDRTIHGEKLSNPEYVAFRMAAVWKDGDWKLQLNSLANSPLDINDIDGWSEWEF